MRTTMRVRALVDSTGVGDPVLEDLQRASGRDPESDGQQFEGYKFTSASKQQLMEGLALAIQTSAVTFPPGPITQELETFEYEHTATGTRYSAPDGFHDDCVMALALAVQHRSHAKAPMVIPRGLLERSRVPRRRLVVGQMGTW